jgi:WD40 repeat protein
MIELFAYKQICCEHCGFGFSFTGFGSAAKIVCPACGEENALIPPQPVAATPLPEVSLQHEEESLPLCSVQHCPLLTGSETGNVVAGAIAEQLGLRLLQKKKRRRTILAWTVTLQVSVLLGVALFVTQVLLTPKESEPTQPIVNAEIETEKTPLDFPSPTEIAAASAIPEPRMAHFPFATIDEPTNAFPSVGMTQDVFPPPLYDFIPPPIDTQITEPDTLVAVAEKTVPPTILPELLPLEAADDLLESAKTALAIGSEESAKQAVQQAIQALTIYEQHGQPLPDSMYWILGNAFASLSWGDSLLESSPAIETMTLSPNNRWLLAQLKDKKVWLWDLRSPPNERKSFLLDSGTAEYVKFVFSSDLRWLFGGQKNGTIRIWDMKLENPAKNVITITERVPDLQDLQISPDGQWLAAFGRTPRNAALAKNLQPSQLKPNSSIQQVSYQRDRLALSDSSPYPVLLWNLRQMETGAVPMAIAIPSFPQPVQAIQFSPNSDRLAVGRKDAVVRIYDLTARGITEEPFVLRGHQLAITQIAFSPSGQWIATGSQDNTIRLWNLTGTKVSPESATLYGHLGWISALAVDPSGEYLCSGSYDRTIRIWNVKGNRVGTALKTVPIVLETNLGVPESLFITQDGDKIIAQGSEGCLGIYHLPSLVGDDPESYYRAVTFRNSKFSISKCLVTSDDQLVIFSYDDLSNPSNNGIRLWSLLSQSLVP